MAVLQDYTRKLQKAGDFHGTEVPASSHVCQCLLPEVSV